MQTDAENAIQKTAREFSSGGAMYAVASLFDSVTNIRLPSADQLVRPLFRVLAGVFAAVFGAVITKASFLLLATGHLPRAFVQTGTLFRVAEFYLGCVFVGVVLHGRSPSSLLSWRKTDQTEIRRRTERPDQ